MKLEGSEVHLWSFPLEASSTAMQRLKETLSADERDRAARFHFQGLRDAFVCAHGTLRSLLARYLNIAAAEISFIHSRNGKPAVRCCSELQFNMTHSGNRAAVAVTAGVAIGIDLESIRPLTDLQAVARRFFCPEEFADLLSLPLEEREHAFFLCWTRKEAYIKAVGEGLLLPLDKFRVTLKPQSPVRFLHIGHSPVEAESWTLEDLAIAPGFAAALAYRGRRRALHYLEEYEAAEAR